MKKPPKPLPAWPVLDWRPGSLRELLEYTRAGEWVPGDQNPWLERAGKAYGYCLAAPFTAGAYALTWVAQRPSRVLGACVVAALLVVLVVIQP